MTESPEYKIWRGIYSRCHSPSVRCYPRYGGRGVAMCDRWREPGRGFENFHADVGTRPSPDHSVERIDNAKGYEPGNVRWATRVEQARNKRNNVLVEFNGERRTVAEWCEKLGLLPATLSWRIRMGWTPERALGSAAGQTAKHQRLLIIDGETRRIYEWAKIAGLAPELVHSRIARGWGPKAAIGPRKFRRTATG